MAQTDQRARDVARIIKEVANERIPEGGIVSVRMSRDTDFDGDPIIVIQFVIDTSKSQIDAKKSSGLVRHVRSRLAEIGEFAFPLLSFISKAEEGN